MTGTRAATAALLYLCLASSAGAFTFSTDALHALVPAELSTLANADGPVLLWMEPDVAAEPGENLAQLCAFAHGEVYATGADVSPAVSECVVRQRSLLGNAWMEDGDSLLPYTWYRLFLSKGELTALAQALTVPSVLPGSIREELTGLEKSIADVAMRVTALETSANGNAEGDARLGESLEGLSKSVASLASSQEAFRSELDALEERPPDAVVPPSPPDPVADFLGRYWRILVVAAVVLVAVFILIRALRQRKEPSASPRARPHQSGTAGIEVVLVPPTPPYTEATVAKGVLRDTITVEAIGESDVKGSHERVYKTPFAPRVRESNLAEHISTQWQKSHP